MPTVRKAGRPSLITTSMIEEIANHVSVGVPKETAAELSGIDGSTFFKWQARGRDALESATETGDPVPGEDEIYVELIEALQRARAKAITHHTAQITKHARDDWRAAAWALERLAPKQYARPKEHRHSGKVDSTVDGELSHRLPPTLLIFDDGESEEDEEVDQEVENGDGNDS